MADADKTYSLNEMCSIEYAIGQDQNDSYFCGYYYHSPLRGGKLLCHRTAFDGRDITDADLCDIGYWDIKENIYVVCARTGAFNWQQGAMLQWLPDGRRFIFNQRQDDRFVSVVHDPETGNSRVLPYPVYAVHPSGEFALAVNFEHLAFCRDGYNYKGVYHKEWDVPLHLRDGIFRVDLKTGETNLLIRTADIVKVKPRRDMKGSYHWLEHMIWNPSGTRFAFLHRWAPDDRSGSRHITRLFTANADGNGGFLFPDVGFYSHMNWHDENSFTVWSSRPGGFIRSKILPGSVIRRLLKPAYGWVKRFFPQAGSHGIEAFQGFIEYRDQSREWMTVGEGLLKRNGHNTWTKNGRYMLSDTYEDAQQYRHLFLYDSLREEILLIGSFYSPFNASGFRCDLHPRFDETQTKVIIDSAHQGRRNVYVIDIRPLLGDKF